jgi:hypothetical protein
MRNVRKGGTTEENNLGSGNLEREGH